MGKTWIAVSRDLRLRNYLIISTLLIAGLFPASPLLAQTAPKPQPGTAQTIPDLSGIWEMPIEQLHPGKDVCGEGACNALQKIPSSRDLVIMVEEPQMLPSTEERYKSYFPEGSQRPREDADPWLSACTPSSPSWLMFSPVVAVELRQFPDVVFLLLGSSAGEADHTVRRVYMDGRGHPPNLKPTWMGHSIGRYDGDTLVVDTIGIRSMNGNRWLDNQGHTHTDALHLVERIRRVDLNSMEFEVTMDDPQAYKSPWAKKIVRKLAVPGPRFWDEANCAELLRMGTHFGTKARQ